MTYLKDLKLRIGSGMEQALAPQVTMVCYPRWNHTQDHFPYAVMRLGGRTPSIGDEYSDFHQRQVQVLLIINHQEAGVGNEYEDDLDDWIVLIEDWFQQNGLLLTTEYPTDPVYLDPRGLESIEDDGYQVFVHGGDQSKKLGVLFTLTYNIYRSLAT